MYKSRKLRKSMSQVSWILELEPCLHRQMGNCHGPVSHERSFACLESRRLQKEYRAPERH